MSEQRPANNSDAGNAGAAGGNSTPADDLRALIAATVADDKKTNAAAPPSSESSGAANSSGAASRGGEGGASQQPGSASRPGTEGGQGAGDGVGEGGGEARPAGGEGAAADAKPGEPGAKPAAEPGAAAKPAPGGTEAPAHWSAEDKATFAGLPEAAKTPFLDLYKRMESGLTPKLQRGAQLERDYGELDRAIFTPEQRQIIAAKGLTPVQLINGWADVERGLSAVPRPDMTPAQIAQVAALKNQIVARIIHNYRVDPGGVAEILHQLRGFAAQPQPGASDQRPNGVAAPAANGAAAPAIDPRLDQRLQALETETQRQRQEREAQAYRAAGDQITAFANETDSEGQLKHPFFAELQAEMTSLAQVEAAQGRAPVLSDLYDRALWANPSTREKHLASQREAEAKRAAEERRAKAEQARRAGSSVTGAPGPGQTAATPAELSLRDQIKANMNGGAQTSGGPGRI